MELGQRPLRTKQLTERVQGFSARTVYRCLGSLQEHGLVERRPRVDTSSRVLLRLTEPAGRNLFRLLRSLTSEAAGGLSGDGGGLSWDSLRLLGELWESGAAGELSRGSRSLVELLDAAEGLTYHQVRRRTTRFVDDGLLESSLHNGNGRSYELTDRGRRCMIVIAAVGRWRHRHYLADGTPGLGLGEMATVLRTVLPLVALPGYAGVKIGFAVGDRPPVRKVESRADIGTTFSGNGPRSRNGGSIRWIIQSFSALPARKSAYRPFNRSPSKETITFPASHFSSSKVPESQILIVPAPY